jgi:hypothetical protein
LDSISLVLRLCGQSSMTGQRIEFSRIYLAIP